MTMPTLMCILLLSAAPDPALSSQRPPVVELCPRSWEPAVDRVRAEPFAPAAVRTYPPSSDGHPCVLEGDPEPGGGEGAEPVPVPVSHPGPDGRGTIRVVSDGEGLAVEPAPGRTVPSDDGPVRGRTPLSETVPGEGERTGRPAFEPSPVQMVHHVSTTPDPGPAETVARAVGNTSTVLLGLLGVTVLVLRLTVGWPRFPEPYLGRRRAGGENDPH